MSKFTRTFASLVVLSLLVSLSAFAQNQSATVPTGTSPDGIAVNIATNKIYVANTGSNNVTVIDGFTYATATVAAGTSPSSLAINPVTNKIYIANWGSNNVTVIDGASNSPTTVATGTNPYGIVVNPVTNKVYVANWGSNNVTVIDGASNSVTTVAVGTEPQGIALNLVTNKIYVTNWGSSNMTAIDGASNSTSTVTTGTNPGAVAVNPVTNKVYVTSYSAITILDATSNSITTIATGAQGVVINPVTNRIYVTSNNATIAFIDGATNAITPDIASGSVVAVDTVTNMIYGGYTSTAVGIINGATNAGRYVAVSVPISGGMAVNPVTNKLYVVNSSSNCITVVDGATNTTATASTDIAPVAVAVNPVTNKAYTANWTTNDVTVVDGLTLARRTFPVGTNPDAIAVNPMTNMIYVANYTSNTITIINGNTNSTSSAAVGIMGPEAVAVNPITNKIYVADIGGVVSVVDGITNQFVTVDVGGAPQALAINTITDKIYIANWNTNNVVVLDGATNTFTTIIPPTNTTSSRGEPSNQIAVNPVTNKIYVANWNTNDVTVIDGVTNAAVSVPVGTTPTALAVNSLTNMIYVSTGVTSTVTVINGATNSTFTLPAQGLGDIAFNEGSNKIYVSSNGGTVTVIDGSTNGTWTLSSAGGAGTLGVDALHNKIYIANGATNNLTLLTEANVASGPLTTTIGTLPNNEVFLPSQAVFNLTVSDTFGPYTPAGEGAFLGADSLQSKWLAASGSGTSFVAQMSAQSPGIHTAYAYAVDAQFAGINFDASSIAGNMSSYLYAVLPASTTSTLSSSANPVVSGSSVTFTATVKPSGSKAPTGIATFMDGSSFLGTATLVSSVGALTTSSLAAGTHSITVVYGGDANNARSTSAALTETVTASSSSTTTTLASSANPAIVGAAVTFTATVTTSGSKTPTGNVTFSDGSTVLGTGTLNASAVATYTTSSLAVGQHSITAVYGGDANNAGSTSTVLTETINSAQAATATAFTSSANPATAGSAVTFTATVTTNGPKNPTGTVNFMDGATLLTTGTLNASGIATYTTATLPVGQHSMRAVYGGDSNNGGSSSSFLTETINSAATTTSLASSANPAMVGSSINLTAMVTTNGPQTATGSIVFYDSATLLGASTLNASGVATLNVAGLTAGQHSITAVYGGDSNDSGSTSAVLYETINAIEATTTTYLSSGSNAVAVNSAVTFTATVVTNGSYVPTGIVNFYDTSTFLGSVVLDVTDAASLTTSSLAVGQHSITASYVGDSNNLGSTSAVFMETVNAADFAMSANPASATVSAGSAASFTITVTPQGSFPDSITLTCAGLPTQTNCLFSPAALIPNANTVSTTLTISTAARSALASSEQGRRLNPLYAVWLIIPSLLLGGIAPRRKRMMACVLACAVAGGCFFLASCGGANTGGGGGGKGTGGTPAGTYSVNVTGAGASAQHTTTLTLTVQ